MEQNETHAEIWWPSFCGNHSLYEAFWSEELTLLTNSPILTSCFQDTILTWIPVGFLIISAIHSVRSLRRRKVIHLSWRSVSVFCNIKTVLCIFLAVLGLARFLNALIHRISNDDGRITNAALLSSFLTVVAQAYVAALTHVTFRRGRHTSGVLFIFWSFALICGVTSLVSQVHYVKSQDRIPHVFQFAISCASFLLIVVQFFANCFADKAALRKESQGPQPSEFALKEQAHYKDPNSKDIMLDGHVQNPLLEEQSGKEQVYVKRTSPQEFASFLSCATFWWFNWIVAKGFRNPLKYSDLWDLSAENLTGFIFLKFEAEWKRVKEQHEAKSQKTESSKVKQPSLLLALVRTYGAFYATGFLLLLVHSVFFVANPIILDTFIHFMQDKDNPYTWQGYTLALLMFGCTSVAAFIRHNAVYIGYITSLRIKTVVITNVYRKMLRLSCTARKESSGGAMVNMMAVDAQKLPASLVWSHYVVVAPLELVFTVLLLWRKIGVASLVGVAFLALIVPLNLFVIGSQIKKAQMAQMKLKDERLKLMNQVLSGIKVLKLYAWEPHFQDKILAVRKKEVRLLRKIALLHTINGVITYSAVAMVAVLCFVTYVSISDKNILTPDVTFVSLSIISMMNVPAFLIPSFTILAIQGMVSLKRIQKFLLLPEIDPESITHSDLPDSVIQLENATFSWGDRPILNDLNIRVKTGELVAVVGRVGAGKSSVISGLLGDMEKISGSVNIQGSIAYVPQQAWIQNLTLRDNILFSCPYVQTKYENVLESCALNADLQMLPAGDMTEIGERGINLSGGQKQRVSLARAVYQEEDIYLLDDPLSAVDAHVGKHLFEKVIGPEGVLKNKTRILVTNSVSVLPYVDRILVFVDGSLVESGILEELKAKEGAFVDFLQHHVQTAEQDDEAADELGEDAESDILSRQLSSSSERSWIERQLSRQASSVSEAKSKMDEKKETENGKSGALVGEELAKEGMVKCSVLRTYVLSASLFNMGLATVGFLVTIGGYVGNNVWLSIWSDEVVNARNVTRTDTAQHIGIYSGLAAVQLIGQLFLSLAICLGVLTAAKNLHRVLLTNIFRCPMAFFDTTPLGRIINRFSKDVDNLDSDLREYIHSWLMNFAILVAVIIIICYSTPIFMVAAIPIALAFFGLQRVYIATARQLKRIDSIRRSPIFANFSETINGVSSIRAYNQEQRFISHADAVLNDSHKVWYTVFTSNRWIGVLADFLASVIVLCSALSCVIQRDSIDPGTAGLSMSFALQINQQIVQIVRYSCEIETYIVAVERIKEYFDEPKEAPFVLEGKSVAESWPPKGEISFNDYSTRYRPGLQLVLKGMTFKIDPGEKVGVIGRTGAGKSSLTLSLFRIIEAAGGAICIDGEDISSMGLHDLRSRLTIIPQDPVLFSGSLRFNVDPSEEYTDEEVLNALTLSHLKDFVASLPEGLDYECGEDGQNLSVGQRQLVCLTRALLRKTKVLILDEATAAVDMTTDDLIQRTIRTEFSQCTIVTIAHRLQTIMDYDRILVMDEGKLKEFDSPNKLLSKSSSIFYGMVKDAGLI